jgi:hypothetical protein
MSTTARQVPNRWRSKINDRRGLGAVALSAVALVVGMAVWLIASTIGYGGENTGTMVGILVASVGLVFFFPALQSYLLVREV